MSEFAYPPAAEIDEVREEGVHDTLDGREDDEGEQLQTVQWAEVPPQLQHLWVQACEAPQLVRQPTLLCSKQGNATSSLCQHRLLSLQRILKQATQVPVAVMPQVPQQQQSQQVQGQAELQTQLAAVEKEHTEEELEIALCQRIVYKYKDCVGGWAQYGYDQNVDREEVLTCLQLQHRTTRTWLVQQAQQLTTTAQECINPIDEALLVSRVQVVCAQCADHQQSIACAADNEEQWVLPEETHAGVDLMEGAGREAEHKDEHDVAMNAPIAHGTNPSSCAWSCP